MPFTINGEWIPEPISKPKHPVKIIKEKRRASYVTLILNLPMDESRLKTLCSKLKQRLGCGGSVKKEHIELQGDQVENVKGYLNFTSKKESRE